MSLELSIPVESGEVSALLDTADDPIALLVLAHGSGAGKDHPFMAGYAQAVAALGVSVLRFNFPYMDAGKKFPDKAPTAVSAWIHVRDWAAENLAGALPIFAAGKSFGGRMASVAVSEGMDAAGLVFLGYPLQVPMLFLEGTRDPFANPQIMADVASRLNGRTELVWFEGGDHSFKVARSGRTPEQDGAGLAQATARYIRSVLGRRG